jgi:hypothetical protein
MEILGATGIVAGGRDRHDGDFVADLAKAGDQLGAGHALHLGIEDDAVDGGEAGEHGDGLRGTIGGNHVEQSGFDDQLADGNAAWVLLIDDQKTGADHFW